MFSYIVLGIFIIYVIGLVVSLFLRLDRDLEDDDGFDPHSG